MKQNCWEFHKCGRELGGANAAEKGVCPAAIDNRLHGVHDGNKAGRSCWVVAGTLCGGETQGTFGKKFRNCELCDFYKQVRNQEQSRFMLSITLLNRLKNDPLPSGSQREVSAIA